MRKIVLIGLCVLCLYASERGKQAIFSVCMKKFNNPLFCEFFSDMSECNSKLNAKILECQRKYKGDPTSLKEICDKMENEESAKMQVLENSKFRKFKV